MNSGVAQSGWLTALDTVVSIPRESYLQRRNDGLQIAGDPPEEMYKQATLGDVDFITGDYLAGETHILQHQPELLTDRRAL